MGARFVASLAIFLGGIPVFAAAASFTVRVDISAVPELTKQAQESKALCEEWYPKINEILYGRDHALPYSEVVILFEPRKNGGIKAGSNNYLLVATTKNNIINMPSNWLQEGGWDFRALLIHELTHVCQNYKLRLRCDGLRGVGCLVGVPFRKVNPGFKWLTEGMADFVAHTYYLKDNEPSLRMDRNGYLNGYDKTMQGYFKLQEKKVNLGLKGYVHGYAVASSFLLWLEQRKDRNIIQEINVAMNDGHCKKSVFERNCGAALDKLWEEFIAQSK